MKNEVPVCETFCKHDDLLSEVEKKMPSIEQLYDLADLFRIFGDTSRIRILSLLSLHEMCVCDIATALELTVSAVSHQLRILKQARLVRYRKSGKSVIYALDDDHVKSILLQGIEHISEDKHTKKE